MAAPLLPHWPGRHPSTRHFEPLFRHTHLTEGPLRETSQACSMLADAMVQHLHDGPELSSGLRKLLEAKDCFVRQAVIDRIELREGEGKT